MKSCGAFVSLCCVHTSLFFSLLLQPRAEGRSVSPSNNLMESDHKTQKRSRKVIADVKDRKLMNNAARSAAVLLCCTSGRNTVFKFALY